MIHSSTNTITSIAPIKVGYSIQKNGSKHGLISFGEELIGFKVIMILRVKKFLKTAKIKIYLAVEDFIQTSLTGTSPPTKAFHN